MTTNNMRLQSPTDEEARLAALRRYEIVDTPPEEAFDRITRVACTHFRVPIALVSLIERERQWFKSCQGLSFCQTSRDISFCAHAVAAGEPLIIPDATKDPRFASNPLVTVEKGIRFYAGAPLVVPGGFRLGTLCIIDTEPRRFQGSDVDRLVDLARMVSDELELRITALELRRLETMRDSLTHMLIHDLRNPLSAATAYLSLAKRNRAVRDDAEALRMLSNAEDGLDRLNDMISSLLDISRLESGEMPLSIEPCDVEELVRSAVAKGTRQATEERVDLRFTGGPLRVRCDETLLGRVVCNLVSNALKFTPPPGKVQVHVRPWDGDRVRIEVADEGPGIAPEDQGRIFEKFAQVEEQRTTHSTGLGLTFCKLAVEAQGGTIGVESELGLGSRFFVMLPLQPEESSASAAQNGRG